MTLLATRGRRVLFGVVAVILIAAVSVGIYVQTHQAAAAATATLTIFTGNVSVRSASNQASHNAATGDHLRQGDEVTTSPATKAAIAFPDGSLTRLDSNTQLTITTLTQEGPAQDVLLKQDAGKTWHKVTQLVGGSKFNVAGPNSATAEVRGTEFSVIIEVNAAGQKIVRFDTWQGSIAVAVGTGTSVIVPAGLSSTVNPQQQPSQPAPIPPGDKTDSWTVFNQTADTTQGAPTSLAVNALNQGQDSGVQPGATSNGNADLDFALGWPGSQFELTVYDPDHNVFQVVSSASPPVHIIVPRGRSGAWTYRVRDLQSNPGEVWWVIVSETTPSKLAPTPFFTTPAGGTPCDHTVAAGATDLWTVTARSAAGRPSFAASGLPAYGNLRDNGDGSATLTFNPPSDVTGVDQPVNVVASIGGATASLGCVEHVRARPRNSTIAGTVTGPGAGVTVAIDPGGQVATTDAAGTYQFTGLAAGTYTVSVTPPAGWVATSPASVTRTVDGSTAAPPSNFTLTALPAVRSIAPTSGPAAGGTSVVIHGIGFTGATQALFGSAPATTFHVDSDSQITAVAPAQAQGLSVDIRVQTPLGTSPAVSADRYTYLLPLAVTASANPTATTPGTPVSYAASVTGGAYPYTYLWDFGDGNTASTATAFHVYTGGGSYTATVTVRDSIGQSAGSGGIVIAVGPGLNVTASASPAGGASPLSTTLTAGIAGGTPPYAVTWDFGDTAGGSGVSTTHQYAAPGVYTATATVTDAAGLSQAAKTTVTATPTVTSVQPSNGPFAGGTSVIITGTGFAGGSTVYFGTMAAGAVSFVSPTQLTASSPRQASPGTYDVYVVTNGATSPATTADRYTYAPPPLTSTTAVSATPNPAVTGQTVTVTIQVTGSGATPTGTATLYDGGATLAALTLYYGTASYSTSALSAGSHSLSAVYGGDTTYAGSTSPTMAETINPGSVTVSLSGTPNPSGTGQTVTFPIQVSGNSPATGTPSGVVTLYDGATSIGSATLDTSGLATITDAALTAGSHSITAHYGGDARFAMGTSPVWMQTVNVVTPPVYKLVLSASPALINANGTSTSTIVAHAVDAFGSAATATSPITVTIASSNTTCCTVTTATTVIGTGQQDSTASPATVTSTTTQGSANITGTSSPSYPVQQVTLTTTTRAIGMPAEVLAPPGGGVPFTVTVNPAPTSPLTLNLSTLNTAIATVTPTVTIAANATSATATLTGASGLTGVNHTTLIANDPLGVYATDSTVATVEVVNLGFNPNYYNVPATVSVNAQVTLSAAAPASGLRVFLATYSDSAATIADTSKATVPAFIDVPGGQLTSPVFQITGVAPGTAYVKATGTGVTAAVVTVSVAQPPTLSVYQGCCGYVGAGMQRNWYVNLSYNPGVAVAVALSSSDPTHLTVPASVTVASGQTQAAFPVTGVAPTTSAITITVSATGWVTGTGSSQVAQASLSVSPYYTTRTTQDPPNTFTLSVQTAGCGQCDTVVNPLTATLTVNSTPTGNVTAPATATIPAGSNSITFSVSQAQNPGTYTVSASDGNTPFTDSAASPTVTVTAPTVSIQATCCGYVAAGMQRTWYLNLSNPAPNGGLTVNLTSGDTAHATVPATATVPGGQTQVAFLLTGVAPIATPVSISAAAAGWAGNTVATQVSTAHLQVSPYYTTRTTLDPGDTFSLTVQNPTCGQCDASSAQVAVLLTVNGAPSTITTAPYSVYMPAGSNSTTFQTTQASTAGTYTVSASDGNSPFTDSAASATVTVTQPAISIGVPCCGYVAAGMQRTNWSVNLSNAAPATTGLTVALSSSDPAHLTVPPSVVVPASGTYVAFTVTGVAATTTPITITATSSGWSNGTATTQVTTASLQVSPYYQSRTTLDPANTFSLTAQNPTCGQCDSVVNPLTATLTLNASPAGITTIPTTATIPAGANSVTFQATPATGPGTYSVSASDGNSPLTNSPASPTVTVTQPAISISVTCCGNVAIGMNRTWYVSLSNPAPTGGLTVNLGSTAPTIAGVPNTATVPQGQTSVAFTLSGLAGGSSTITASAPNWSPGSASTSVVSASLQLSPYYTTRTTLDAPNTFTLSIQNPSCGQCDSVASATQVSLSGTATPAGTATFPSTATIAAGTNSVTFTVTDTTVGSYTMSAAATTYFAGATSPQVTVTQPFISITNSCCGTVAAGLHRTMYVSLSNGAPAGGLTVTLGSSNTAVATVTSSVVVPQGQTSASFVLTALTPNPVTITATASGWTTGSSNYTIPTPSFQFNNVTTARTVNSAPNTNVTVSAYNPTCGACDAVNANVTVTIAVAGTPSTIVTVSPTTLTILANAVTSSTGTTVSTPTATGTYNLTGSAPGFTQGASSAVTVT